MSEENKSLAERFHMDLFQQGDLGVADEILSPDFVIHAPGYPPEWTKGPEGAKKLAQAIIAGIPDRQITHHQVVAEDDLVMIRWSTAGTHDGDMMDVPATGKPVSITGFDLFGSRAGRSPSCGRTGTSWE